MSEFTPKGELTGGGDEPWASEEDWVMVGVHWRPEGQLDWFKYIGPTRPAVGDLIRVYSLMDYPDIPPEIDAEVTSVNEARIMGRRPPPHDAS